MKKPLVSIGVPSYNRPVTLQRTMESLINQTYENIEIIVSDNGSTDCRVEEVLRRFSEDSRVKVFRHQENRGAVFNFNFILDKFSGSYVMRIGDDDWVEHNYVESCVNFLTENPDYICAYGSTKIFDSDQQLIKEDTKLSLDQSSPKERILTYYENVTQNGIYFGLLKREYKDLIKVDRLLADDWIGVARVCFLGKVRMLSDTNLKITAGGTGSSVDSIVDSLGISNFNRYFPYLSVCFNVARDIMWRSAAYRGSRIDSRILLAIACVVVLSKRFRVRHEIKNNYFSYLKSLARQSH